MMLNVERRKIIRDMIIRQGTVKVAELAVQFDVGEATIRRDLKALAEEYGIQLTYGGAFLPENRDEYLRNELSLSNKQTSHLKEKMIVAKKAAALIQDGDTIALNAGSTVELILDYIQGIQDLKVVTLGLNIAAKAATIPGVDVYMPGGKLRKTTGAFFGMDTEAFLSQFNVDKCFFGALAVSESRGVTHPAIEEIETNQIIMGVSRHVYLVVDSSKFDKVSLMHMADLNQFDGIVVDEIPKKYRKIMEKNKVRII